MRNKKSLAILTILSACTLLIYAFQTSMVSKVSADKNEGQYYSCQENSDSPLDRDFNVILQQKETERVLKEQEEIRQEQERRVKEERRKQQELSRSAVNRGQLFELTAYDLSEQSCGKSEDNPDYGKTASGINLAGESWDSARAIAVDPRIIPLGSQVYIKFVNPDFSYMNGYYTAVDTGGAIKGNRIDFFMGDHATRQAMKFGRQEAYILVE